MALLALLLCGCAVTADGDATMLAADTWYIHGITVTATGAPVGGGTVELWRGAVLVGRKVMTSQSWLFGVRAEAGTYQVRYTPPTGWQCISVNSVGIGWRYPSPCVAEIVLPTYEPGIGPDVVFTVGPSVQTVTPTATLRTPTATTTATPTATEFPTIPMPPPQGTAVAPPIPTPRPMPTPPPGGWAPWEPPADLANALGLEVDWILSQYAQAERDPLWLAAASSGPCWAITTPVISHYEVLTPEGANVERTIRWQAFVTPAGWRVVFATVEEPYQVAIAEGEGW